MTTRRAKRHKSGGLLRVGIGMYLCICLFSIVWLQAAVKNVEYELGELDHLKSELTGERKMMVAKRASFYATEKIEKVAIKRLGMKMRDRNNVFYVKRTKSAAPYKASMK